MRSALSWPRLSGRPVATALEPWSSVFPYQPHPRSRTLEAGRTGKTRSLQRKTPRCNVHFLNSKGSLSDTLLEPSGGPRIGRWTADDKLSNPSALPCAFTKASNSPAIKYAEKDISQVSEQGTETKGDGHEPRQDSLSPQQFQICRLKYPGGPGFLLCH